MDIITQMNKIWPDWTVVDRIGAGAYGHVYKISRTVADRTYYSAVKVITVPQNEGEVKAVLAEEGSHSATKAHFREIVDDCIREITIMMDLRGAPNVVEVEDFKVLEYENEIRWDIYIRMEYLTCLTDILTVRKFSEKEAAKLGVDICSALEICEKKQVIHRDIKPGNIFVSEFGIYKLGDFGIARQMDRASGTLSSRGTYDYMAPEMFRGMRYDANVDLYALGIVLYKIMNRNRAPFLDPTASKITAKDKEAALGRRISGEKLPAPCDASLPMSNIILKACSADPTERFRSPGQMKAQLETILYERSERVMRAAQINHFYQDDERTVEDPDVQQPKKMDNRPGKQDPYITGRTDNGPGKQDPYITGRTDNIPGRQDSHIPGRENQPWNPNTNYAGFTPNSPAYDEEAESKTIAYFSNKSQGSKGRRGVPLVPILCSIALLAAIFCVVFIYQPLPGPVHNDNKSSTDSKVNKEDSTISASVTESEAALTPAVTGAPTSPVIQVPTVAAGSTYRYLDEYVAYESIAIGFRKGDEDLARLVNGAISALVLNGTYDRIGEKYPEIKDSFWLRPENIDASTVAERGSGDKNFVFKQGIDSDYPPYSHISDDGNVSGFDVELCMAVCEYLGWEYEAVPLAWDEKDLKLGSGACDCIWSGLTKEGREDNYTWGATYAVNAYFVLVPADSDIHSLTDLENKVVGVPYDYMEYNLPPTVEIKVYDLEPAALVNDFKAGVVDAMVVDNYLRPYIS